MTKDEIIKKVREAYEAEQPGAGGYPAMGDRIMAAMEALAEIIADDPPKKKKAAKRKT